MASTLFFEADMAEPVVVELCGGTAVALTAKSPTRDTSNEDAVALIPLDDGRGVLAVADGVGGLPGGAMASKMVLELVAEAVEKAAASGTQLRTAILDGIERANEAVLRSFAGASTLAAVEIDGRRIRSYHVGDSLILVTGQRGRIKLQSVPHSPTGYAVEAGFLDEWEAMVHEDRHIIDNAVGSETMRIEIGPELELAPFDTLLLATDGLTDNLHPSEIVEHVRKGELQETAVDLFTACRARMLEPRGEPSKPDDLSFVAFRMPAS